MKIIIDDKINEKCSQVAIGSIEAYIKVSEENEELWKLISEKASEIEKIYLSNKLQQLKILQILEMLINLLEKIHLDIGYLQKLYIEE